MTTSFRIVSGGQTGADRAALDFALAHEIPHGGWCPAGRWAEDGVLDAGYQLHETPGADPAEHTEWNVRDTEATAILSIGAALSGGSRLTAEIAGRLSRPCLHLAQERDEPGAAERLVQFLLAHRVRVLNVAGPRASSEPGIGPFVTQILTAAWTGLQRARTVEPRVLTTARLRLRPLALSDAPVVARLAGRREIAEMTLSIPHPHSEPAARQWIERALTLQSGGTAHPFAITLAATGDFIGAVGVHAIDPEHWQAEMGFWIAVEHWRRGYASEAAEAIVRFAFETLRLNRVYAHYLVRNPASGRVLQKAGLRPEGVLRQRTRKWGVFQDTAVVSLLYDEWRALHPA